MKSTLYSDPNNKGFKPFNLMLVVETPQEARLLAHVFNHTGLLSTISTDYPLKQYHKDIAPALTNGSTYLLIEKELSTQGFKL